MSYASRPTATVPASGSPIHLKEDSSSQIREELAWCWTALGATETDKVLRRECLVVPEHEVSVTDAVCGIARGKAARVTDAS